MHPHLFPHLYPHLRVSIFDPTLAWLHFLLHPKNLLEIDSISRAPWLIILAAMMMCPRRNVPLFSRLPTKILHTESSLALLHVSISRPPLSNKTQILCSRPTSHPKANQSPMNECPLWPRLLRARSFLKTYRNAFARHDKVPNILWARSLQEIPNLSPPFRKQWVLYMYLGS